MAQRLLALLTGLAFAAVPATAAAAPSELYDCGTSFKDNVGNGWCHGTGTFRIVVGCADGTSVKSPWIRIHGGFGTLGVSCRAAATGVNIGEAA
jgi:hypothetical protein